MATHCSVLVSDSYKSEHIIGHTFDFKEFYVCVLVVLTLNILTYLFKKRIKIVDLI